MLKKHAQFFKSLFIISDLFILSLAWILSYVLRFYTDLIKPPTLGVVPFLTYLTLPYLFITSFGDMGFYRGEIQIISTPPNGAFF